MSYFLNSAEDKAENFNSKFLATLKDALNNPAIQNRLWEILCPKIEEHFREMLPPEMPQAAVSSPAEWQSQNDAALQKQNNILQSQIAALHNELTQRQQQLDAANAEKAQLRQDNQRLSGEKTAAEQRCKALQEHIIKQEANICTLNSDLAQAQQQLTDANEKTTKLQKEIEPYRVFNDVLRFFQAYRSLPQDILPEASRIIRSDSAIYFFATGCQRDNVLALWDFMKSEWENLDDTGKSTLLEMVKFFLNMLNSRYQRPVYQLMGCHVGDTFDDQLHIRTADSSPYTGAIRQVCLPGILNIYNGETVVRKSLVVV